MQIFEWTLVVATLLCSLTAGFVLAFAVVVMPGIATLADREMLRAFQVVDRVIQNNHPIFMLVWVGSVVTLLGSAATGFAQVQGMDRLLLGSAVLIYLLGVQVPTMTINVPLNNQLQTLDLATMDDASLAEARRQFEPRWNRWNRIRTVLATLTSSLLIVLVLRL